MPPSVSPTIEVLTEEETARGWSYRVAVSRPGGRGTEHTVTLAWVDHEHWCGGALPPSRVVESLMRLLAAREHERPIPPRFDAAAARRWFPDLDRALRGA